MYLCKFKNMFGEVGTGLHSIRLFNIAIIDVLLTIIGAWILHHYLIINLDKTWNFSIILISLFILGIILHRMFCVRTTIDRLLFP